MEQEKRLDYLLNCLLAEQKWHGHMPIPENYAEKRALLRALTNVRLPFPISKNFVTVQNKFLKYEAEQKGIVGLDMIPSCSANQRLSLWQGDITRLAVDVIVNAANVKMLGCFVPGHHCIDNAIHTAAGIQLRDECHAIMQKQGQPENVGIAKITKGYNLPAKHVMHTVGPTVDGELTEQHCDELANCYSSCLALAIQNGLTSVAFCCISTGIFAFPKPTASKIAVGAVLRFLKQDTSIRRVVFNVFTNEDFYLYKGVLDI